MILIGAFVRKSLPAQMTGSMARHSGASLAMKMFALGCGFLFAVAAARLLGPSGYGIVAVAISAATVVATVALLGIDGLALRETAALATRKDWGELRHFIRWACKSVLGASMLAAVMLSAIGLAPGPYRGTLIVASLAVPLLSGVLLLRGILQGAGHVIAAQLPSDVIRWLATLALIGIMIIKGETRATAVIVAVIVGLAVSLMASAGLSRRVLVEYPRVEAPETRTGHWMRKASPFLALALFGIVGTEISTLLLGWLSGPREAGLYQPIAKLAPIMLLANYSIEAALAPRIVQKWHEGDRAGLQRLIRRSAIASTIVTAAITGMILIASTYILRAFGRDFTIYRDYLYWIGAAQLVNAALGSSPLLLAMVGNMRPRLQAQAATLIVQSGLCIALIPSLGAAGAAISLTAAILVWTILHWWLAWRDTGIDTSCFGAFGLLRKTT
jgi:O-antigen/teichoic acid export membrane protein